MATVSIPSLFTALVDDAAVFPPARVPLTDAIAEHRRHRSSEYAAMVGGFVVSDTHVPELGDLTEPLAINLVIGGGAGAITPAVTWVDRAPALELRALEFALRDEDDLAHNARRLVSVLDSLEGQLDDVTVYTEPPMLRGNPHHGWLSALDELAAREVSLKFRTGGVTADLFPSSQSLAVGIEAALDRELPFKCTAGLHNAVRHTDPETGFTHHGFLNVLVATRASLDGDGVEGVAEVLEQTDGAELAARIRDLPDSTRRWFTSFGSCDVLEAHHDLVELGLIEGPA